MDEVTERCKAIAHEISEATGRRYRPFPSTARVLDLALDGERTELVLAPPVEGPLAASYSGEILLVGSTLVVHASVENVKHVGRLSSARAHVDEGAVTTTTVPRSSLIAASIQTYARDVDLDYEQYGPELPSRLGIDLRYERIDRPLTYLLPDDADVAERIVKVFLADLRA